MQNRYLKINANKFLPSIYNFSIYIDGNIVIINDINELLNKLNAKYGHYNFYLPIIIFIFQFIQKEIVYIKKQKLY